MLFTATETLARQIAKWERKCYTSLQRHYQNTQWLFYVLIPQLARTKTSSQGFPQVTENLLSLKQQLCAYVVSINRTWLVPCRWCAKSYGIPDPPMSLAEHAKVGTASGGWRTSNVIKRWNLNAISYSTAHNSYVVETNCPPTEGSTTKCGMSVSHSHTHTQWNAFQS